LLQLRLRETEKLRPMTVWVRRCRQMTAERLPLADSRS
jgi:hypothetical protein